MRVLLTGDSHLGSLRRAQSTMPGTDGDVAQITINALGRGHKMRSRFFDDRGDHAEIIDVDFRKRLDRLPPAGGACDWIGFSGPLNTARFWRSRDFQVFTPYPFKGEHVLSLNALTAAIEDDVRCILDLIGIIKRTVPVFVIDAPWPFADHPAVASIGADRVGYLHRVYRKHVLSELSKINVPVVELDSSCVDSEGFMKKQFRHENPNDIYHANAEFGRIMLNETISFLAGRG